MIYKIIFSFLLAIIYSIPAVGQGIIAFDNFDSGSFFSTQNWDGDTTKYSIADVNGFSQLKLNDAAKTGKAPIFINKPFNYGSIEFYVNFLFTGLSNSNKLLLYFGLDKTTIDGTESGYLLSAGETGTEDVFRLYRVENGTSTLLASDTTLVNAGGDYRLKLEKDTTQTLRLSVGRGRNGPLNPFVSIRDTLINHSGFAILEPNYTSTRSENFVFDSLTIAKYRPFFIDAKLTNPTRISLEWSEKMDLSSAILTDFNLSPGNLKPSQIQQSGNTLFLDFAETIPYGDYTLEIASQNDLYSIASAAYQTSITVDASFTLGDIVINEFMYNPPSGLVDYVELINLSAKTLNISDWVIRRNNATNYLIPQNSYLKPNEIVALTADTSALFSVFGHQNYIKMNSFPTFNKTTPDQVRIYTDSFVLVDSLQYDSSWLGDNLSLERKSTTAPTIYKENWGPSTNALGGTPGFENTVLPDTTAPKIVTSNIISATSFQLIFDKTIVSSSIQKTDFSILNGPEIDSFLLNNATILTVKLAEALTQNQEYTLTVSAIDDIFGNSMPATEITLKYVVSAPAETGDILISEFLYDQPSGYTEFIELYNSSNKYIDIKNFTYNDNSGNRKSITSQSTILNPQELIVIAPSNIISSFFPSARIISMASNFAALNNTGDAIVIRTDSGELLDSLTYTTAWGGTKVSLERRSFSVDASFIENWGDSPNPLFATAGSPNEVELDTTPPQLKTIETISTDSLILTFSERIDAQLAKKTTSYTFESSLLIDKISVLENGKSVAFKFAQVFNENQDHSASVDSVKDIFGNLAPQTIPFSFEYVETTPAQPSDLIITEFLYDPPSGYSEFIELYNNSDKFLDLSGYTYSDNAASPKIITDDSYILKPNQYVVLTTDETLASIFPDATFIPMGSRFNTLNNSGDHIVIKNATGITLDSLAYTSSWGGVKKSLERKDYSVPAKFSSNWGDSPAILFASPGFANSVTRDITAPVLTRILVEPSKLLFIYDEQLDEQTALNSTISTSLNRIETARTVSNTVLTITYSDALSETIEFTVTIGAQKDIFGNANLEETRTISFVVVKDPVPGSLIITEFVYKASDLVPEFIELYNNSDENIDLNSLQIADNKDIYTLSVKSGFVTYISPKQYLAISADDGFSSAGTNRVAVDRLPSLNDTGSDAVVVKFHGQMIDSTMYQFPAWSSLTSGQSFERKSFDALSIDPVNWGGNPNKRHSAGKVNEIDTTLPAMKIEFAGWLSEDTLSVYTSQYISSANDFELFLDGTKLQPFSIKRNQIMVEVAQPSSSNNPVVSFSYLKTGFESTSSVSAGILSNPDEVEPFIISEIMFNPLSDENARQSDFIEVYNPNPIAVILPNQFLQTQSLSTGSITNFTLETKGLPVSVGPKKYAIIYPDTVNSLSKSRIGIYFSLADTITAFRVQRTSLSLSSTNTAIKLLNTSGLIQDSVDYLSTWHNANVTDTKGRSLERILLNGPSNDATNWTTSGNPLGATPGAQNSNYILPGEAELNKILVHPNPFSPDEDGFEDNTTISWNLDGANYLIQATIYDRFGRKVRTLAEGVVAGKSGSLVWDGKRDDGTSNRIGIYILLFKAVDNSSGKEFIKKETIVIARMM